MRVCRRLLLCCFLLLQSCVTKPQEVPLPFSSVAADKQFRREVEDLPAMYVISDAQQIALFAQNVVHFDERSNIPDFRNALFDTLRAIDYAHSIAVFVKAPRLVLGIQVQKVVRQGNRVVVHAEIFTETREIGGFEGSEPYHLIAVTKEGDWSKPMTFELVTYGDKFATVKREASQLQ